MLRKALLLVAALAAFASPALAAIGTPVLIGQNVGITLVSTQLVVTTTQLAPAGDRLVMAVRGRSSTPSVVDCNGNTWTLDKTYAPTSTHIEFWSLTLAANLPSGCAITLTWGSPTGSKLVFVVDISGIVATPVKAGAGATGSSNLATIALSTVSPAPTISICEAAVTSSGTAVITADGSYTRIGSQTVGGTDEMTLDFRQLATTAGGNCAPGIDSTQTWLVNYIAYGPAATSTCVSGLTTTGAGSC